jgi:hypothetical protein
VLEWRKTHPTTQQLSEFAAGLAEPLRGIGRPTKPPKRCESELMLELPIYDAHVGKYAWAAECGPGQDWDTDTAVRMYLSGAEQVMTRAGVSPGKILVVFGGDYFHSDTRDNRTELSGHALDVDSRYARNIRAGAVMAREIIRMALRRAGEVEVVVLKGNHSWHSEHWLAMLLEAYWCDEPRVTVRLNPAPRQYVEWGRVLLGLAHGDRVKPRDLPNIMAVEAAAQWSRSVYRHFHLGHIHKAHTLHPVCIDSHVGVVVEYLPSLTSTDAWHAEQGYVNPQRVIEGIVWDRAFGQVSRLTVPREALES